MRDARGAVAAIHALREAGLIDASEADSLQERVQTVTGPAPKAWRVVPSDRAAPAAPAQVTAFDTAVGAPRPETDLDPYESLARGLSRLGAALVSGVRDLAWRRIVLRGAVAGLVVLVAGFWVLLAAAILDAVPPVARAAILLTTALAFFVVGHARIARSVDTWAILAVTAGSGCALLAVASVTESIVVLATGGLAVVAFLHAGVSYRRVGGVLSMIPVLGLPWLVVRLTESIGVPRLPVLVVLSLAVLVVAAMSAAPVLVAPPRRRYAWAAGTAEALVGASFAVLLVLLPVTIMAASGAGSGLALGVALLLAATFILFGVRTRSYVAIAAGVGLVAAAPVFFVFVVLGPVGWLLAGVALGAFIVHGIARRGSRARAASGDAGASRRARRRAAEGSAETT